MKCDGVKKERQCEILGEEGNDWVKCLECNFRGKSLGKHLSSAHQLTSAQYLTKHSGALVKCIATRERYSQQNKVNANWIERRKAAGDDLKDYRKKMGKAVSTAILSNQDERARRATQMAKNNRTDAARELSRNTAKKTSARPEILAARSERLARWRNENFDVFYEKCVKAMHSTWHSKPELALFTLLQGMEGYQFKHNQVIKSDEFSNTSKRKQIDVADAKLRVYVEFDGIIHFEARIKGAEKLSEIQNSDRLLDEHVSKHRWTLIRISYDQFSYNDGGKFSDDCLRMLFELLRNPQPGVYRIGDAYNEKTSV